MSTIFATSVPFITCNPIPTNENVHEYVCFLRNLLF